MIMMIMIMTYHNHHDHLRSPLCFSIIFPVLIHLDLFSLMNKILPMTIIPLLLKELEQEAVTTRKMLALVPADKLDYKPHPKSMVMSALASHIAELPGWVKMALTSNELDFATMNYAPPSISSSQDLLNILEENLTAAKEALENTSLPVFEELWTLRNGDQIYSTTSKYEVVRMSFSQVIHHRAQLGVYLRLLNIPIPGSYGPSADEHQF
jgi:uncharacterized damage-inducible protein DinB